MITFLPTALKYASKGLHVFPVKPGAKTPLTKHGCKDATTDAEAIQSYWAEYPDANIGVATGEESNLVVLDFDCKDGKPGLRTLDSLRKQFRFDALEATTPSGGVHLFFRYSTSLLKNGVDVLPGMDVRTAGGYVLVAPSIVDGKPYQWTRILRPAELSDSLLHLLSQPKRCPVPIESPRWLPNRLQIIDKARRYVSVVPPAVQGQAGDVATYKLACTLVRGFALTDDEAFALLAAWNWRCQPMWSENELLSKIASARRNGTEPFAGKLETSR